MHSKVLKGLIIGMCGGTLGGLVGIGGGIVMIPLMVYTLGLSQHMAHGNSLSAIVFTGLSGAFTYYLCGSVDVTASIFLAISSAITARCGAKLANTLTSRKLRRYFGILNIFVSFTLIFKNYLAHSLFSVHLFPVKALILLLLGSFTGFLSGLFGVGGGTIMVPGLVMAIGMSQQTAQGTSLLAMVPMCLSGASSYYRFGHVDLKLVLGLSLGALLGGPFGATLANILPEPYLRILFSFVLLWVAVRYIRG